MTLPDSNVRRLVIDVAALAECDVRTVDALARLALAARRERHLLVLAGASSDLRELLDLAGLARVVRCDVESFSRRETAVRTAGRSARCRGRT